MAGQPSLLPSLHPPSTAPRLFSPSANSLPLGEGGREPVKALVKTVARCGTACLDIPLPVAQAVQAQLVRHLRCRHCVREVLYIRRRGNSRGQSRQAKGAAGWGVKHLRSGGPNTFGGGRRGNNIRGQSSQAEGGVR